MSDPLQIADSLVATPQKKGYKPKTSNKAPAVKAAVLISRANGKHKREIARELGISRPTVDVIISEANLDQSLEAGRIQSVTLIPEAIRVAKHRLSQNSENMAIKVLENTVWPLNGKAAKPQDMGLTLAIQNLMGNVTVNQPQANETKVIDVAAEKPKDPEVIK